ncbi:MAG: sigma-70 family RNA polymerase sigma factor [Bacteroidota bacterium]
MSQPEHALLTQLFRTESGKLTAVLGRAFGLAQLQMAEDVVSDTFLLAMETWGKKGIPDNPTAWLYTVAKNKVRDLLRRDTTFREKVQPEWFHTASQPSQLDLNLSEDHIQDSQLRMLFAVCHPSLPQESQIALALRSLAGFGIGEIAEAFLTNKSSINKRLYRAKTQLREANIQLELPPDLELSHRLGSVLRIIYLLFNEGYAATFSNQLLQKDLCLEAMHLGVLLTMQPSTHVPEVDALLALMCFHASRLDSRIQQGQWVLYEEQDQRLWDRALIQQGERFLNQAARGEQLSKYHLEAAIAFWHTKGKDHPTKWEQILQLYNYLLQVEYSPMAALNRTYAVFRVRGAAEALRQAKALSLETWHWYHCLLADLHQATNQEAAKEALTTALGLAKTEADRATIQLKMDRLGKR